MADKSKKEKPDEIRRVACKGCGRILDDAGCMTGCKFDIGQRPPESMEIRVYTFTRTEPYKFLRS